MNQDTYDLLDQIYNYFGRVTINWRYTELALQELTIAYLGLEGHIGWLITESMGNNTRCEILAAAVDDSSDDTQELKEHILYAIKLFNICRENRNHLIHSFCEVSGGKMILLKFRKGIGDHIQHLDVNWETLEETFGAIEVTENYISSLRYYLDGRGTAGGKTLPEKPPTPDKLKTRLLFQKDDQPPPEPSGG